MEGAEADALRAQHRQHAVTLTLGCVGSNDFRFVVKTRIQTTQGEAVTMAIRLRAASAQLRRHTHLRELHRQALRVLQAELVAEAERALARER